MATKTVLIADDDRALVQALAVRCRQMGLQVDTVPDGMQAYDAISSRPPDLLILDVQMPSVNGLYLCDELARDTHMVPIPTIILTGRSDRETVERCEALGAHYVWKGLDTWDRLKPLISRLLGLPAPGEQPAPPAPAATTEAPEEPAAPSANPKVLVIDDDSDLRKAVGLRLRAYGVEVVYASNGMQGYWVALKDRPDVILTDYTMPEGYANWLIGRLKDNSLTAAIPVIVMTGRTIGGRKDYPLERTLLGLGACAYLTKPLDFDALLKELGRHIALQEPATPAGSTTG